MTVKLVVLYGQPEDAGAFDKHYRDVHVPLVDALPNLDRWELGHFTGAADGGEPTYFQVAELYFADQATLEASMGSEQGKAASADFGTMAPPGSRIFVCALD